MLSWQAVHFQVLYMLSWLYVILCASFPSFLRKKGHFGDDGYPLVWYTLIQLFTLVSVKSGGCLPRRFAARQLYTTRTHTCITSKIFGKNRVVFGNITTTKHVRVSSVDLETISNLRNPKIYFPISLAKTYTTGRPSSL